MDFFEAMIQFTKDTLQKNDPLSNLFVGNTIDNKCLVVSPTWENDKQKEMAINYVRMLFLKESVHEYCFLSEIWFKHLQVGEGYPEKNISELPDKKEGIFIIHCKLENAKIIKNAVMYEVVRGEKIEFKKCKGKMERSIFSDILSPIADSITPEVRQKFEIIIAECERRYGFTSTYLAPEASSKLTKR